MVKYSLRDVWILWAVINVGGLSAGWVSHSTGIGVIGGIVAAGLVFSLWKFLVWQQVLSWMNQCLSVNHWELNGARLPNPRIGWVFSGSGRFAFLQPGFEWAVSSAGPIPVFTPDGPLLKRTRLPALDVDLRCAYVYARLVTAHLYGKPVPGQFLN